MIRIDASTYTDLAQVAKALPDLVRTKRERLGWSQRKTAKVLGVSFSTVHRIEAGHDYNSRALPAILRWLAEAS